MSETDDHPDSLPSSRRSVVVMMVALLASVVVVGAVIVVANNDGDDDVESTVVDVAPTPPTITSPDESPAEPDAPTPPVTEPDASVPPGSAAVSESATTTTTEPEPEPLPGARPVPDDVPMPPLSQFESVELRLEKVLDLRHLTGMEWSVIHGAYYAVTQDGVVRRIPEDLSGSEVVLDMTAEVTELLPGSERGMLGIAFDPRDGRMFLHFTDLANDSHVVSFEVVDGRPDPGSRRQVLFQEQPGLGHQGGAMHFDDEGHLFISFGDGGGSRGRDAQDYGSLHGSIVRLVPRIDGDGYDVPVDNPFAGRPDHRGEIWVKGLRNPWQFSINRANGDLWLGDVGEDTIESLYHVPSGTSGQNFGWYWFEGTRDRGIGGVPDGLELTPPVYEYPRTVGVSIIGGVVYHGDAIPQLTGAYVFADLTGPFFAMGDDGVARLGLQGSGAITAFAETPDDEILVLTLSGGLYRLLPA
jgi:glucose/arabinose dehydrogenase